MEKDTKNVVDVSVIVPMYNVENLITETIESLKKNECNFEVILINDGSTDNTLNVALNATYGDSRFRVIDQLNKGVAIARNNALKIAQGEYITFVDSDDLITENGLDKLYYMAKEQNSDFIYGAVKKFTREREWYLDGHIRHGVFTPGFKNITKNPEVLYFIGVAGKLIHRSIFKDLFFPEGIKFSEDTAVMVQLFVRAKSIYTIQDVIYYYRERDIGLDGPSATQKKGTKGYDYLLDLFQTILICKKAVYDNDQLTKKEKVDFLKKYYDRIFAYEVWPLFVSALNNKATNKKALIAMYEFLQLHTRQEINQFPAIRLYLIKVLIDRCYLIRLKSYSAYVQLLRYLFDNLTENIHKICAQQNSYGKKWEDSWRIAYLGRGEGWIFFLKVRYIKRWNFKFKNDVFYRNLFFNFIKTFFPQDKNKVVFATHKIKPFSANFDAVYKALMESTNSSQYDVYKFLGETTKLSTLYKRYYHLATANIVFLEDYYKPIYGLTFSKNTNVMQIWHACGAFKKFAHDALGAGDSNSMELEKNAHGMYTDIIVSSQNVSPLYSSAFDISIDRVKALGVPRTDLFFDLDKISKIKSHILKRYPYLSATKNILYSPTFRGGPAERKTFNLSIDWNKLKEMPRNYKFIIKLHPVVERISPEIPDWIKDRVLVLNAKENVNDWMLFCDVLITDYSSLIFEYSLLDKPIIYYPFDLKEYFNERGFYYSYDTYIYGEIAYTSNELVQAILNAEMKHESFYEAKDNFKKKFMGNCDGKASQRIIRYFLDK